MARKLFSLENDNTDAISEDLVDGSVGEVADAQTDVTEDTADITEDIGGVEEGIEATDGLEQVEDLVEGAVDSGEGLDPVAAEAIRIAVEAICSRVGANPKAIYSLYATENFSSPSARKSNSAVALEGVREFLKEMWAKIKASLTSIWTKVKAFWAKHVSTLGRVKKALDSMKSKVSASTGKLEGPAFKEEAPSGLVSAFAGKDDINAAVVTKYIESHKAFSTTVSDVNTNIEECNAAAAAIKGGDMMVFMSKMSGITNKIGQTAKFDKPLIGGVTFSVETEGDAEEGTVSINIQKEEIDSKESKLGISVATKDQLKGLITSTLEVIGQTIKAKDKANKVADSANKFMTAMSSVVDSMDPSGDEDAKTRVKQLRRIISQGYKLNAKAPSFMNEEVNLNIKLAKAVLGYSAFCLKSYK